MYNSTTITLLTERVGWSQAVPPTSLVVSAGNLTSTSGRFFDSFHTLVTAENVNDSVINLKIDTTNLNAYLAKMRKDAVLEVLNKLFDTNDLANYASTRTERSINYDANGYDALINKYQTVFDQAIGYSMAVRAIQLFITSERSNSAQRKMKASYEFLKSEIEGIRGPDGEVIAKGVNALFTLAIEDAKAILFPVIKIPEATLTDRSGYW